MFGSNFHVCTTFSIAIPTYGGAFILGGYTFKTIYSPINIHVFGGSFVLEANPLGCNNPFSTFICPWCQNLWTAHPFSHMPKSRNYTIEGPQVRSREPSLCLNLFDHNQLPYLTSLDFLDLEMFTNEPIIHNPQ